MARSVKKEKKSHQELADALVGKPLTLRAYGNTRDSRESLSNVYGLEDCIINFFGLDRLTCEIDLTYTLLVDDVPIKGFYLTGVMGNPIGEPILVRRVD